MKKENIYVKCSSQNDADFYEKTLLSLNEKISDMYEWNLHKTDRGGLYFSTYFNRWTISTSFGAGSTQPNHREQITFGQLIDLLNEPKKLAVKVENDKEFKALMKYYDSLDYKLSEFKNPRWNEWTGKPLCIQFCKKAETVYHEFFGSHDKFKYYQIIPFAEFAEEKGIKLPLITTLDGFDLFEGDEYWSANNLYGTWVLSNDSKSDKGPYKLCRNSSDITNSDDHKAFSTKQAALEWIEAHKPKEIVLEFGAYKFTIKKDSINISHGDSDTYIDISSICKAMEELQS